MSQVSIIDIEGNNPQIPTQFDGNIGFAIPIGNNLNIDAQYVLAGTNPARTVASGNTVTTQIQLSQAIASSNVLNVGLASFNSSNFSVDPNGFVSLIGGGLAIDSIAVQTGTNPVIPTADGLVTINGATVAAGTNPVRTDGTGPNTMAVEVQISQAIASTDATKIGLSNFDSSSFNVDANGFVSISGTGVGQTITGDTGGALSPTAGNWNILGSTSAAGTTPVSTSGSGSTLTANVQISQAIASTDATKIGLCNFDSSQFSVDSNGFVTSLSSSMFSWTDEATSFSASEENGYFVTDTATATLPASPSQGDTISFACDTANVLTIQANTGQFIRIGSSISSSAGTASSNAIGDSVTLVYRSSSATWIATSVIGTFTLA